MFLEFSLAICEFSGKACLLTSLIYWCIFMTTVNNQEKAVTVMMDKNVSPTNWYFHVSVMKIHDI